MKNLKVINLLMIVVLLGVFASGGYYYGTHVGFKKGYNAAMEENKVIFLNVGKMTEKFRNAFVEEYKRYKPEEINEKVREEMSNKIKDTSKKIVNVIRKNYQDALIVDPSIEGCVVYQNERKIPDVTEEVIKVVSSDTK